MRSFTMNGILWNVCYVDPYDDRLIDRTGVGKLGVTDPTSCHIYLSTELIDDYNVWSHVIKHELAHCVMISYDLISTLRKYVKRKYWIVAEEELCNFIADYSEIIVDLTGYLSHN